MTAFKPINKRLGDLLVETNLITPAQLAAALDLQRKKGVKIGRALLDMGYVTEDLLLAFLGRQCGISYVSLKEFGGISPEAVRAVPEYLARQWEICPLKIEDDKITVAVSEPFNLFATDDLRLISGLEVSTVIAPADEIRAFVDRYYVARSFGDGRGASGSAHAAIETAVALGATEMYFDGGSVRYFFGRKYLKTVELAAKEADAFVKYFKLKPVSRPRVASGSGGVPRLYEVAASWESASALKIKVRNFFSAPSPRDYGLSADDAAVAEKHLNAGRGLIAVSGAPASGKTAFMSACARLAASPHKIVYYLSDSPPPSLEESRAICSAPPGKDEFPSVAHNVFFDSPRPLSPSEAQYAASVTSSVAAYVEELPPAASTARLYVRLGLAQKLCPACRRQYAVSKEYIINSGLQVPVRADEVILSKSPGCPSCGYTGRAGVVPFYFLSEECASLTVDEIRRRMLEAVWERALASEVSVEEVLFYK